MTNPAVRMTAIIAGSVFFLAFVAIFAAAAKATSSFGPLIFALVPIPIPFLLVRPSSMKEETTQDFERLS